MTAIPIPAHELKGNTWYYGLRCACERIHALCEDLFEGKISGERLNCAVPLELKCECGTITVADSLQKFKTP